MHAPPAPTAENPHLLPWDWFDFTEPARALPVGDAGVWQHIRALDDGGWRNVWGVEIDGGTVPFKVFRKTASARERAPAGSIASPRPVLMMVHGMGLTIASFRGIAPYLLKSHDLILPDYSGFCLAACRNLPTSSSAGRHGSLQRAPDISMKHFVRTLWRIADALKIERLSFAGHSLGGGVCLMAGIEHPPRIDRMLLSNPACFPQSLPRMYRLARVPILGEFLMALTPPEKFVGGVEYIGYVDKSRFDGELKDRYIRLLRTRENRYRLMNIMRQLPAGERDLAAALHLPHLATLSFPVLITWGEQDPLLVPGAGLRLAQALPNATYDVHPDLAHIPHEESPATIGPIWSSFLTPSS